MDSEIVDEIPRRRVNDVLGHSRRVEDTFEDVYHRIINLEKNQVETQYLLRENAAMSSRLNDTLVEMKEEFKSMRTELHDIHDLEITVTALQASFSFVKWIGGALGGAAIALAVGYAAKVMQVPMG